MVSKRIKRAFVPQQDSSDCGPACLLSLIKYYGGDIPLSQLRSLCGTSSEGTSMLGLSQAAEKIGFDTQGVQIQNIEDLNERCIPCILVIRNEQYLNHFVLYFGIRNKHIIILDPSSGVKFMTKEKFDKSWIHICLLLTPNTNLNQKSIIRKEKRKWFKSLLCEDYPILAISIIFGILLAAINIIMSIFSQLFIDKISPSHNKSLFFQGIVVLSFFLISYVLIAAGRNKLLIEQEKSFNIRIVHSFLRKIFNFPKSFFDNRSTGDMVARLNDTKRIQAVIEILFGEALINLFIAIVSLVSIFYYSWHIALICLCCIPLFFFIVSVKNGKIISQQRDMMAANALTESSYINTISGISDIKLYSREEYFLEKNKLLLTVFQNKIYILGKTKIGVNLISGFGSSIVQLLIVSVGAYFVFNYMITIGAFIAIIGISGSLFSSIASLAQMLIPINEARVAFDRMYDLIIESYDNKKDTSIKEFCLEQLDMCLELKNVSFRYPGQTLLLKQIETNFNTGEITCIVGPSGSGKSTLCKILGGLYFPSSGRILINGCDINSILMDEWKQHIALVPQQSFLFSGTILDNICMGEKTDSESFSKFVKQYNLQSLLVPFSYGLNMVVEEHGKNLSEGQRKIIAFIRALYKHSEIIILDEISASMDYYCERLVYKVLEQIKEKSIIIYITHKLESAKIIGDRIVVLENGIISADGTHEQLLQSENYYSNYWQ